ncbi:MAG: hypothetical protein JWP61_1325 [Friedmanniella sp.]|nr:hypothetical protein [Friedmanniella sp.]
MSDLEAVRVTNVGSWPGVDMADALKIAFAECPELPYLPELPARGAPSGLVGRSTAVLSGLALDLQPAGWRLTDASGRDHRLARSTLRTDLDLLEEHAQGYAGLFKVSVAGPWTLAAMLERPRGDRMLADHGGRRDLAQSLAQGAHDLLAELRRRLPDLRLVLQLDEPLLPAVLAGGIPTASGFSRHRVVDLPEASAAVAEVVDRVDAVGDIPVVVHCCAAGIPVEVLRRAGVRGFSVDLDQVVSATWDKLGPALEDGLWVGMGALPAVGPGPMLSPEEVARRTLAPLRALGLEPEASARIVLTPSCGLAGATPDQAVRSLRTLVKAAEIVTDQLAD